MNWDYFYILDGGQTLAILYLLWRSYVKKPKQVEKVLPYKLEPRNHIRAGACVNEGADRQRSREAIKRDSIQK